jgi:hypothetical protein
MYVIKLSGEIVLVAQRAFPIAALPIPRSLFAARLAEIGSPAGKARVNPRLINRQRVAKSASPAGKRVGWVERSKTHHLPGAGNLIIGGTGPVFRANASLTQRRKEE